MQTADKRKNLGNILKLCYLVLSENTFVFYIINFRKISYCHFFTLWEKKFEVWWNRMTSPTQSPRPGCCFRHRSLSAEERRELAGFGSRSAPAIAKYPINTIQAPKNPCNCSSHRQQLTDRSSFSSSLIFHPSSFTVTPFW